jgi:tetratricopeptide (TPR) repeat protein
MRRRFCFVAIAAFTSSSAGVSAVAQEPPGPKLAPLPRGVPPTPENRDVARLSTEAAEQLVRGRPSDALLKAEAALAADATAQWAHYQRAVALAALGRDDEALDAYREAERLAPADDAWGLSLALWGRAMTLRKTGRCDEARTAFDEYVAVVGSRDAEAAAQARLQATTCKTASERAIEDRVKPPESTRPPPRGGGGARLAPRDRP